MSQAYLQVKCLLCGRVHCAVPMSVAKTWQLSPDRLERQRWCFRCGKAKSDTFVPAEPGDSPPLSTLQAIVVDDPT